MNATWQKRLRLTMLGSSRCGSRLTAIAVLMVCFAPAVLAQTSPRSTTDSAEPTSGLISRGFNGGISADDFQPLVDLIQSVVVPDSWADTGGEGTVLEYPSGVFADSSAVVDSAVTGLDRRHADHIKQSLPNLDPNTGISSRDSDLRILSLNRIEEAIAASAATGRPIGKDLKNLAGMYQVKYVMIDAVNDDFLIAGPAGAWRTDTSGRNVNKATGLPTLQLDDLMVCLGNAFHHEGKFGCTIVPKPAAMAAAQKLISSAALNGTTQGHKWRDSLRETVGKQDVIVRGVSPDSGVAQTIVEADVLMKKIGMGVEPSIEQVPNYFERVKEDPAASDRQTLIRWWFTMAYDSLIKDADNRLFMIDGNSVKVLSENELLDQQGQRIHTGKSDKATAGFAGDFTKHFDSLSKKHAVLASLKNVFDLALVANIVRQYDTRNQIRWRARFYANGQRPAKTNSQRSQYSLASFAYETEVDSIMNFDSFIYSDKGRRFKTSLVGVSGGVDFNFSQLYRKIKLVERSTAEFPRKFGNRSLFDSETVVWWRD